MDKEQQKNLIIEMMKKDEEAGLYLDANEALEYKKKHLTK